VVVSGWSAVGAFGAGRAALAAALSGEVPAASQVVDRSAGWHRRGGSRRGLVAADVDLSAWLDPAPARRMSPPARFAVAAARQALVDSGLTNADHAETAVVVGTAFGPACVSEQLVEQILRQGPANASPALFTESVASAAAGQIALVLGARGPSLALTEREASDLLALAEGARLVASGAAARALVVVVDEVTPMLHATLDRFRALARPEADGREVARPFDRRRSGGLAAEGAAVLVLETAAAAAARGARPRARCVAFARGFDPTAPAWSWGRGAPALARTLARGLARGGVDRASLELVVSGASGAVAGDRLEAAVLREVFGAALPPVAAPKGALGAYGGGHLAAALLAAEGAAIGGATGFLEADPELGVVPRGRAAPARRLLVSALAAGGAAAWAVLDAAGEAR